jgi:hypothetical protein
MVNLEVWLARVVVTDGVGLGFEWIWRPTAKGGVHKIFMIGCVSEKMNTG